MANFHNFKGSDYATVLHDEQNLIQNLQICDMIKENESDVANIDFEL